MAALLLESAYLLVKTSPSSLVGSLIQFLIHQKIMVGEAL